MSESRTKQLTLSIRNNRPAITANNIRNKLGPGRFRAGNDYMPHIDTCLHFFITDKVNGFFVRFKKPSGNLAMQRNTDFSAIY